MLDPSILWQVEALTGAAIDRPRSIYPSGITLPALTLTGNERVGDCVRAGEGEVQSSSNAIKFGAVHSCLTYDWPRGLPHLSQLIAQVYRANIDLQVSDAIVDRLKEGANKHCHVRWQIVKEGGLICFCEECVIMFM